MKRVSFIAMLTIVIPYSVFGYEYTITDSSIRNKSYTVEQITESIYNIAKDQNTNAPVFKTVENDIIKYYKWTLPDLTQYKVLNNRDVFALNDNDAGSLDFFNVESDGTVVPHSYYYSDLPRFNNHTKINSGQTVTNLNYTFINSAAVDGTVYGDLSEFDHICAAFPRPYSVGGFRINDTLNNLIFMDGALNNNGEIETISGDFIGIGNSSYYNPDDYPKTQIFGVKGGGIRNGNSWLVVIDNEFIHYVDYQIPSTIGTITGNFINNSALDGGAIFNAGTIDTITGDFVGNYVIDGDGFDVGGAIANYGEITLINSIFTKNSAPRGGAIYNGGTIDTITGDFIDNSNDHSDGFDAGSAIYNDGTIDTITGDFIGNNGGFALANLNSLNEIDGNFVGNIGGAIHNSGTIDTIIGNFVDNIGNDKSASFSRGTTTHANFRCMGTCIMGGAIYNNGTIDTITGDFVGNLASSDDVRSIFVGGAIFNDGTIGTITGDFIDNKVDSDHYPSESISSGGGAIYNNGTIDTITGDFKNNSSIGYSDRSFGGAIFNAGIIDTITGDFVGNYANGSDGGAGGAIYNGQRLSSGTTTYEATINTITGNFVSNSGGAIRNEGVISSITGNFIDNTGGYAIYNLSNLSRTAGVTLTLTNDVLFSGNTEGAIFNSRSLIQYLSNNCHYSSGSWCSNFAMDIGANTSIRFNTPSDIIRNVGIIEVNGAGNLYLQSIDGGGQFYLNGVHAELAEGQNIIQESFSMAGGATLQASADGLKTTYFINDGRLDLTGGTLSRPIDGFGTMNINGDVVAKNDIAQETINVNAKLALDRTLNTTGRFITNSFWGTARTLPTMNLNNGAFDISNGYTEEITLKALNATGNNNFLHIDLDTSNKIADIINIQNGITGQIKLVVSALSDLDIDDCVIWFADGTSDTDNPFILDSVSGLSYDLELYVDSENHKYGLIKMGVTNPQGNNSNEQNNSGNSNTDSDDTNTEIDNSESEQPMQPTLPVMFVQTANYMAKTVTKTVQKLTNPMRKRVGELQWLFKDDDEDISYLNNAFWTRGIHKNFDMNHTSVGLSGLEFGYDRIVSSSNNYKWYIGGLGYISGGDSKFKDNKFDISGYGIGAYVMMLEKSGWFTDLVLRQHFINMETSDVKSDYTATSLNMEIGKEFVFGSDTDELKWFMKPSIEGTYISISGTDIGSFKVQDSTSSMISLSVLVGPRWDFTSGRKFQVYGKLGYNLDNSDDVDVVINGVNTKHKVTTNTAELGIGFDYRNSDNSTNVYLEVSYITGTDYSEISGILGLRYAF